MACAQGPGTAPGYLSNPVSEAPVPRRSGFPVLCLLYSAAGETGDGMTAQDWLPGLDHDEAGVEPATSGRRPWPPAGAAAPVVLLAPAAVGAGAPILAPGPPSPSAPPPP